MSILTCLLLALAASAALLARGRPAQFLGFFCLLGLGCVIAASSLAGLTRHSR
ncbi:hypothetical protein [Methylobacterium soli]|uniref:hypothetical protein n=1 Tax=Methylobacterium soli TaxID=553447 RepID=UPI001AEF41B5|nr:hypothetical protein [Methylobacterium soli]